MKKYQNPTGFVAKCQCGAIIGTMDYVRIERHTAGQMLGQWLREGYAVEPRFTDIWSETVELCRCEAFSANVSSGSGMEGQNLWE